MPKSRIQSFKSYEASQHVLSRLPSLNTYKPKGQESASRPSSHDRGYGYRWKVYRDWYLKKHIFCACCGRLAEVVDHIRPIRFGGEVMNPDNHQPLCRDCHVAKTAREESVAKANGWLPLWGIAPKSSSETPKKPPALVHFKNKLVSPV